MEQTEKKEPFYNQIEKYIIVCMFLVMTVIIALNVVTRFVFNFTLSWGEQLARLLLVWTSFAGISWAGKINAHMRVTALSLAFKKNPKIFEAVYLAGDALCSQMDYVSGRCIGNGRYEYTDYPAQSWRIHEHRKGGGRGMIGTMLGVLFICLLGTVPIAVSLGLSCVATFSVFNAGSNMTQMLAQSTVTSIDSFSLMAIPFFMLVGSLMERGGIAKKLVDVAEMLTGTMPGGLGMAAIVASMFFAAISGSGPATAAAIGGIMIGAMTAQGYSKGYSGALIAAGSTIGPVIPPSIPMIMYGVTIGVSVSYMFIAGIIPGVLMGVALMIYNYFASKKRGYKGNETKAKTAGEKAVVLKEAIPAILMPVIILGGIYSGVFTPTESAVIGVVYAIIVAVFVYHHLSWKAFCQAMFDATITSATIMILFGAANTFGRILTMNRVPTMITDWMLSITSSRAMIMLMINIALLIIGMFLDTISSIVLFGPIFAPIAIAIGYDPLHFGIIMVINLCIGMITPPMGGNLFVAQRVSKTSFEEIFKDTFPMIIVLYILLALLIIFPEITMFLPKLLGYTFTG